MTKNNQNQLNFIGNIQINLSNTIDTILNHSYLDALEKNDKRNFASMISKTSDDTASKLFTTCLHTELNALENLTLMAYEVGSWQNEFYIKKELWF